MLEKNPLKYESPSITKGFDSCTNWNTSGSNRSVMSMALMPFGSGNANPTCNTVCPCTPGVRLAVAANDRIGSSPMTSVGPTDPESNGICDRKNPTTWSDSSNASDAPTAPSASMSATTVGSVKRCGRKPVNNPDETESTKAASKLS